MLENRPTILHHQNGNTAFALRIFRSARTAIGTDIGICGCCRYNYKPSKKIAHVPNSLPVQWTAERTRLARWRRRARYRGLSWMREIHGELQNFF